MRWLWLTLADPDPATNGQFIYSSGLIQSVAAAGVELTVLGLARPEGQRVNGFREGRILWRLAAHRPLSKWLCLALPWPKIAARTWTPALRRMLRELLGDGAWNAIVFDNITPGWMLRAILARWPDASRRPRLVYVSHNHEESVAAKVTRAEPRWLRRQSKRLDAVKMTWLERHLSRHADIITSNAPEDCALYRASWPGKPVEFLPPGFSGTLLSERRITAETPRRAIIVGSFDWLIKRRNLEEFLAAADPLFAAANVELQVVGSAEETFLAGLRSRVIATRFTGAVEDVSSYMREARVAIVPERTGGGFKLKVLDYIFHRLPIVAIAGSIPGVPLVDGESVLLRGDQEGLARSVLEIIDDLGRLNRLQESAYRACKDSFDWESRGRQLVDAVASLGAPPGRAPEIQEPSGFAYRVALDDIVSLPPR